MQLLTITDDIRKQILGIANSIKYELNDIEFENESEFIRWVDKWILDAGESSNIDDIMNKNNYFIS